MTPAPLSGLQASSTRAAEVLVILGGALILDVSVKLVEARRQRGEERGSSGGTVRLQVSPEQLMHRCLSAREGNSRVQRVGLFVFKTTHSQGIYT